MAVIKAISSKASIGTAINYITKKEKTEEKLISGINCTPCIAIDEMKATKEIWNKQGGRQYKHFVQSFPKDENVTSEQSHKIATELMQDYYKDFEIIIATHNDKDHIHSHIIVNSVSFVDGRKLQQSRGQLEQMKDRSNELCKEYNLSVCEKGKRSQEITTYNIGKYKALERASKGEYKSYVLNTAIAVSTAKEKATSKDEFVELMKQQGYKTTWTDKRKYITFTDKDGKKVRNKNLEKTFKGEFGKEQLQNEFTRNKERTERRTINNEQQRGDGRNSNTSIKQDTLSPNEPIRNRVDESRKRATQTDIGELHNKLREIRELDDKYNPTEQRKIKEENERARRNTEQKRKQLENSKRNIKQQHKSGIKGINHGR